MKTVVFGLFDQIDDARRVLCQLASSPLDLDTVSVVHADPSVQQQLATAAGLPPRRGVWAGLLGGAMVGAVFGAIAGNGALAFLGPLLSAAAGAIVGGGLGAAVGAVAETVRLPEAYAAELTAAVANGATVLMVRTGNLPTARAIRDLFAAGGSRVLDTGAAAEPDEDLTRYAPSPAAGPTAPPPFPGEGATGQDAEDHTLFAPPWRRTPFAARPRRAVRLSEEAPTPPAASPATSDAALATPQIPPAPPRLDPDGPVAGAAPRSDAVPPDAVVAAEWSALSSPEIAPALLEPVPLDSGAIPRFESAPDGAVAWAPLEPGAADTADGSPGEPHQPDAAPAVPGEPGPPPGPAPRRRRAKRSAEPGPSPEDTAAISGEEPPGPGHE